MLVALLLLAPPAAPAEQVTARLETTAVQYGEPVSLVIEVEGDTSAGPDLSVLTRDFEIADRRSQRSVSIVNGQRSARYQLTITLIPRRTGELEVPPIPVGETATLPLQLTVSEAVAGTSYEGARMQQTPPSDPVMPTQAPASAQKANQQNEPLKTEEGIPAAVVEISAEPSQVRVRSQVVLTARVYTDDSVLRSQLRDPQIPNATVLPLGEDRYEAPWNGERRSVYERRYALFPISAGRLKIEPVILEGWARGDESQGTGFPPRERPVRAASEPLSVEVLPAAASTDGAAWLPARSLTLTESGPETYRVRAGQPLERRISLRADGLMSRSLPPVTVDAPYQLGKSNREPRLWDERRPQGVIGTRQEVIVLTAHEPGQYRLPPLRLQWWNTGTGRWETAMMPARELVVTPAAFADTGSASPPTVERWSPSAPFESPVATPAHPTLPEPAVETEADKGPQPEAKPGGSRLWIWLTGAFALAWLATMAALWRNRRPSATAEPVVATRPAPEPVLEPQDPLTEALANVRSAYEADDAAGARDALLAWGALVLPEAPPSNLARLAQRCPEPLRGQILMLEQAFFSPQPLPWERQRVWEHMRHFEPAPAEEPASFRRSKPLRRRAAGTDVS
jgi:hypothetical protein